MEISIISLRANSYTVAKYQTNHFRDGTENGEEKGRRDHAE